MLVHVRLSAGLARSTGRARLAVTLEEGATVSMLMERLRADYPALSGMLDLALPIVSGRHVPITESLKPEQEVAFLLPVAGGTRYDA